MNKAEKKVANYMNNHPKFQILLNISAGLFVLIFPWIKRQELVQWESTGGELTMPRFIYWIYSIGGVNAPAILFSLASLLFFFHAYRLIKQLRFNKK